MRRRATAADHGLSHPGLVAASRRRHKVGEFVSDGGELICDQFTVGAGFAELLHAYPVVAEGTSLSLVEDLARVVARGSVLENNSATPYGATLRCRSVYCRPTTRACW